jgi:hypothetical protein
MNDQQDIFSNGAIHIAMHLVGKNCEDTSRLQGVSFSAAVGCAAAPEHVDHLNVVVKMGCKIDVVIPGYTELCPNLSEQLVHTIT